MIQRQNVWVLTCSELDVFSATFDPQKNKKMEVDESRWTWNVWVISLKSLEIFCNFLVTLRQESQWPVALCRIRFKPSRQFSIENLEDDSDLDLVNDPSSTADITFHLRRLCIISAQWSIHRVEELCNSSPQRPIDDRATSANCSITKISDLTSENFGQIRWPCQNPSNKIPRKRKMFQIPVIIRPTATDPLNCLQQKLNHFVFQYVHILDVACIFNDSRTPDSSWLLTLPNNLSARSFKFENCNQKLFHNFSKNGTDLPARKVGHSSNWRKVLW